MPRTTNRCSPWCAGTISSTRRSCRPQRGRRSCVRRIRRRSRSGSAPGPDRWAASVELHHDADGIRWPMSIAPLHVALLPLQMQDPQVREAGEKLYRELTAAGVEVLLDDRDERAGVKFKDADLIGLPLRLAVGKKGLVEGKVEWKPRGAAQVELVALQEVVERTRAAVRDGGGKLSP